MEEERTTANTGNTDNLTMVFDAANPSNAQNANLVEQRTNKPKNRKTLKTLKPADLTNPDTGISALHNLMTKYQSDMVKKSKLNSVQAMGTFLKIAKEWTFQLNPKYDNQYLHERIVKLGTDNQVRHHLLQLRDMQNQEKENFQNQGNFSQLNLQTNTELFTQNVTQKQETGVTLKTNRENLRSSGVKAPRFDDDGFGAPPMEPDFEDLLPGEDEMDIPMDFVGGKVEQEDLDYSIKKKKKLIPAGGIKSER